MTEVAPQETAVAPVADWRNGLLGCFGSCCLCIKTYLCPCLVFGSTAAAVGKSKCMWTCYTFIPIWNILKFVDLRGTIREKRGIQGGCCGDCVVTLLCGPCALVQEAREVSEMDAQDMARE